MLITQTYNTCTQYVSVLVVYQRRGPQRHIHILRYSLDVKVLLVKISKRCPIKRSVPL